MGGPALAGMSVVQFMRLDNILKLLNEGAINQTFCKMIDRLRKFRRGGSLGMKFIANVVRCTATNTSGIMLNYRKKYLLFRVYYRCEPLQISRSVFFLIQ